MLSQGLWQKDTKSGGHWYLVVFPSVSQNSTSPSFHQCKAEYIRNDKEQVRGGTSEIPLHSKFSVSLKIIMSLCLHVRQDFHVISFHPNRFGNTLHHSEVWLVYLVHLVQAKNININIFLNSFPTRKEYSFNPLCWTFSQSDKQIAASVRQYGCIMFLSSTDLININELLAC